MIRETRTKQIPFLKLETKGWIPNQYKHCIMCKQRNRQKYSLFCKQCSNRSLKTKLIAFKYSKEYKYGWNNTRHIHGRLPTREQREREL